MSAIYKTTQHAALRDCHRRYVAAHSLKPGLDYHESYGDPPTICFLPSDDNSRHGNFLAESYRAILANSDWTRRLGKIHTGKRSLPPTGRPWRELDSSNSSDALLMNVFCYPATLAQTPVLHMLGVNPELTPQFGFKARIPLLGNKFDRTEVDMKLGDLLVESKLTESDFQTKKKEIVETYRDFCEIFDPRALPRLGDRYLSYQLIRNVLAAHAHACSFCVIADARRPDLMEAWYAIMRCVKLGDLRRRCKMLTWQELALVLPNDLQRFLEEKYGIAAGNALASGAAEDDAWN